MTGGGLRILMTADTLGGVWSYALELAAALRPEGATVTLAALGGPASTAQRAAAETVGNIEIVEGDFRLEWMPEPWDDVAASGAWLQRLAAERRPDIVHLNGYAHGALAFPAPVVVVAHSCVLSWWQHVRGEAAPPEWSRYRAAVAAGLSGADAVVAPTRSMGAELARHYDFRHAQVIRNGAALGAFRPAAKQPYFLGAGRLWDDAKNLALLDRIAPALPWPVYIAGDAVHPAGEGPVFRNAHVLGRLDRVELAEWLGAAAIFVAPARYEPFGLGILEAAASGAALVLGDIPSLRELWDGAALFVPPDDADGLAATLRELAARPMRRAGLARRALARARHYGAAGFGEGYAALYRSLLAPRRATA